MLVLLESPKRLIMTLSRTIHQWSCDTVPDLRSRGRRFESRPWLLRTNANLAQLSVPSLRDLLICNSEIWGVNGHTTRWWGVCGIAALAGVRERATGNGDQRHTWLGKDGMEDLLLLFSQSYVVQYNQISYQQSGFLSNSAPLSGEALRQWRQVGT